MNLIIILPIVIAFIFGVTLFKANDDYKINRRALIYSIIISLINILVVSMFYGQSVTVIRFNDLFSISFMVDGLGVIFVCLISFLWPLATLYATKYMSHEGQLNRFFSLYTMTFGVVTALAYSANALTLYLFYEALTFITLPLVAFKDKPNDRFAGRVYVAYSVSGAALSFIGMCIFVFYVGDWDFTFNEMAYTLPNQALYLSYILMFAGFGVKAGLYPFSKWLPAAGVAPTTVTALLHAVAVVKSGVFSTMRLTYYMFEPEYLNGTYVQVIVLLFVAFTIVYGSSMALKSKHLKRRFAYSTVSQLSYILLGVVSMSIYGLVAAILHMIFHALIKIVIFYTAGNVMYQTHKTYVADIEGYGNKMKISFTLFTISSLALIGIPPLGGFTSKISIAAALTSLDVIGFIGIAALMISALLTAIYLLQIVQLAFIKHDDFDDMRLAEVKEAPKEMVIPLIIISGVMILMSLNTNYIFEVINTLIIGGTL